LKAAVSDNNFNSVDSIDQATEFL